MFINIFILGFMKKCSYVFTPSEKALAYSIAIFIYVKPYTFFQYAKGKGKIVPVLN